MPFRDASVGFAHDEVAFVASVSVGVSVHSRHWHFFLFGGAKIGASAANGRRREGEGNARKGNAYPQTPGF